MVRTFVEATVKAIPGARKNTMNANTLPVYVLGVVREKGHPLQLVNAFENPIRSRQGYAGQSVELLKEEYAKLKNTWGVEGRVGNGDSGCELEHVPGRGGEACRLNKLIKDENTLPSACKGRSNRGASIANTAGGIRG